VAGAQEQVDPRAWATEGPSGIARFVPIVAWLPAYDRGLLRFDAIAGATIWGLLVPESIAYAGLAGLPPQAGLYTLLATLGAYAFFGTSRHVVAGPTSAAAVLLASAVIGLNHNDASTYMENAALLVLLCGGLFLVAGALRLGFMAQFLSRPVIESFVFGLAIFVTVTQIPHMLGIASGSGNTIHQLGHVLSHLGGTSGQTLAVGTVALVLLFSAGRFAPRVPGGLLVLVLGILISTALNLSDHGVAVVGHVPSGLPTPSLPSVESSDVVPLLAAAAGMVLVIFSESLGAADNFAVKHHYEIDANQELIALGVANGGSGLFGGLAGGGSLSQSAVNEGAGARSEVSPLVAFVLIVLTLLLLTPIFKDLPEAVLAALIIHAVAHLWKVGALRRDYAERPAEFWLGLATLVGVVAINVLPGLVIGVTSMLLLGVYNGSKPHLAVLGRIPGVGGAYGSVRRHPENEEIEGLLLLRLDAPVIYSNANPVRDRIKRLVGAAQSLPTAVIIDVGVNDDLDITSIEMLKQLVPTLRSAGVDFAIADAQRSFIRRARRGGLIATIGEDHVFQTIDQAVDRLGAVRPPKQGSAPSVPQAP
jgi:high affinity sulfate transporter 1